MRLDHGFTVATREGGQLYCVGCLRDLGEKDVAALMRKAPGDPFETWCPKCLHRLAELAARALEADQMAEFLLKVIP